MAAVTFDVGADAPLREKPSRGKSSRGRSANLNTVPEHVNRETSRELRPRRVTDMRSCRCVVTQGCAHRAVVLEGTVVSV